MAGKRRTSHPIASSPLSSLLSAVTVGWEIWLWLGPAERREGDDSLFTSAADGERSVRLVSRLRCLRLRRRSCSANATGKTSLERWKRLRPSSSVSPSLSLLSGVGTDGRFRAVGLKGRRRLGAALIMEATGKAVSSSPWRCEGAVGVWQPASEENENIESRIDLRAG